MKFASFALAVSMAFSGALYAVGTYLTTDHSDPTPTVVADPIDWSQVV